MIILILCLLITSNVCTSSIFDPIARDYLPNHSNEDYQNFETPLAHYPNNFIDNTKNTDLIKYNELLSLLHNENSNKAVLAHISSKDKLHPVVASIVRGIEDRMRNRRVDKVDLNKDNANDTNVATPKRLKRTVFKWLRDVFHKETTTERPYTKSNVPVYMQQKHEINVNSSFTDLIADLTKAIKTLNQNLVNLKLQVFLIKMPGDGDKVDVSNGAPNNYDISARSKRELNVPKLNDTVQENYLNDTIHVNITEKSEPIHHIDQISTVISESEAEKSELNADKSKREANTTATREINQELVKDRILENGSEVSEKNYNASTQTYTNVPGASNKLTKLKLNDSVEMSAGKALNTDKEVNSFEAESLNSNSSTQRRSNFRFMDNLEIIKKPVQNSAELILHIDQAYKDIKSKLLPIQAIKYSYSSQVMYKIGYIIANLDTLKVSLMKMNKLNLRKDLDARKLLRVYRKLNLSRKLVDNIMGYLRTYVGSELIQ